MGRTNSRNERQSRFSYAALPLRPQAVLQQPIDFVNPNRDANHLSHGHGRATWECQSVKGCNTIPPPWGGGDVVWGIGGGQPDVYYTENCIFASGDYDYKAQVGDPTSCGACGGPVVVAPLHVNALEISLLVPSQVFGTGAFQGLLSVNAPADGRSFWLTTDSPFLSVPQSVIVPEGETSVSFTFQVLPGAGEGTNASITLTNLDLTVVDPVAHLTIHGDISADLGSSSPKSGCEGSCGLPINMRTGNTWIQQRDYSLPGLGGGLSLTRTWNSLWSVSHPPIQVGMFGDSWISNYEERLQVLSNNQAKYWRADGSAWTFTYDSPSQTYSLTAPADENASLVFSPTTTLFTLTLRNGGKRVFTNAGYLKNLADPNGNQTTLTYDASNRLVQATAPPADR